MPVNRSFKSNTKKMKTIFFSFSAMAVILFAATSCSQTRYTTASDDVYRDTIIDGKPMKVKYVYVQPKQQQQQQYGYAVQPAVFGGQTVLSGFATIKHETLYGTVHYCQLMYPIGQTATGIIVWRTSCGYHYPDEPFEPFKLQTNY